MRVYDESTRRKPEFTIQINWSRERAFSTRQRFWIGENIPNEKGVYVIYLREQIFRFRRGQLGSPILYFGSGWLSSRILAHLNTAQNQILTAHFERFSLAFRWSEIESGVEDWPVVAERILAYEFARVYGMLPPANRIRPPARPAFDFSFINQYPLDVIDDL